MELKAITRATAKVLVSYLTYQAVRVVLDQLRETDPQRAIWFNQFSTAKTLQDGEAYLRELAPVDPALAMRVMTVREHLAEQVADFLPELVRTGVQQSNMDHRRQYIERTLRLESPAESEAETPND
ncbi:RuBisCO chaperone RbcX [Gloeobacter morelensis]|uniref:RuBisCO chaperone RbcX n=1 Tax=Gloeobacter morelensis MG652769 TaxID=2781736 RepID=A0ABY3PHE4_9CYAN|nr:chaperonin family protein RbcX [Gloeobacter morelensis]UFP93062.1 chaperonin family protein RbcX [Gloeobacter morelensis MG652769]